MIWMKILMLPGKRTAHMPNFNCSSSMLVITTVLSYSENKCTEREQLDRRRLEEAHLKLCMLDVFKRYQGTFQTLSMNTSVQQSLDDMTPLYYEAFATKYAG